MIPVTPSRMQEYEDMVGNPCGRRSVSERVDLFPELGQRLLAGQIDTSLAFDSLNTLFPLLLILID